MAIAFGFTLGIRTDCNKKPDQNLTQPYLINDSSILIIPTSKKSYLFYKDLDTDGYADVFGREWHEGSLERMSQYNIKQNHLKMKDLLEKHIAIKGTI